VRPSRGTYTEATSHKQLRKSDFEPGWRTYSLQQAMWTSPQTIHNSLPLFSPEFECWCKCSVCCFESCFQSSIKEKADEV